MKSQTERRKLLRYKFLLIWCPCLNDTGQKAIKSLLIHPAFVSELKIKTNGVNFQKWRQKPWNMIQQASPYHL